MRLDFIACKCTHFILNREEPLTSFYLYPFLVSVSWSLGQNVLSRWAKLPFLKVVNFVLIKLGRWHLSPDP